MHATNINSDHSSSVSDTRVCVCAYCTHDYAVRSQMFHSNNEQLNISRDEKEEEKDEKGKKEYKSSVCGATTSSMYFLTTNEGWRN